MTDKGFVPDHKPTSAEAAAAGEDDTWQNEQIVDPDDAARSFDDPEAEEDEGIDMSDGPYLEGGDGVS